MTITAKFSTTCPACSSAIKRGDRVEWSRGTPARHVRCLPQETRPADVVAPCWTCKAPDGRFRGYGARTPVYCDACEVIARRKDRGDCPTCGGPMSRAYAAKGYQCDSCADRDEGRSFGMEG